METKVIEIEHLKKSFGKNHVLKDINCKIEKGENLVVFGKSGSGKSVLIKCLVGLIEADEGKIVMLGKDISELSNEELNVARNVSTNLKTLSKDQINYLMIHAKSLTELQLRLYCPLIFTSN